MRSHESPTRLSKAAPSIGDRRIQWRLSRAPGSLLASEKSAIPCHDRLLRRCRAVGHHTLKVAPGNLDADGVWSEAIQKSGTILWDTEMLKSGYPLSLSLITLTCSGHRIPNEGSSQRTPIELPETYTPDSS